MECGGAGQASWGAQMELSRCSCQGKIHTMIQERDDQSAGATKRETANQRWPNMRYQTYSVPCLSCHLSLLAPTPIFGGTRV
jgi:hypothetical protein